MTETQIDSQNLAIRQLARTLLIALKMAGGKATRGDIAKAYSGFGWRPNRGEVSDAIDRLVRLEYITATVGQSGQSDSNDCTLTVI